MSQDEFKMMEDDDDDDIPDLESVASSEYLDSDEDDLQYEVAEENELRSPNYCVAKKWLESTNLREQFDVLIIYTYSPFLYGEHIDPVHWDKKWFSWFRKANLISERPFNLDQLSIREIRVLEILELSFDWCWDYFGPSENISCLEEIINLWEAVKDEKILKTAITAAKSQKWFRDILNLIDEQPPELKLNNKEFQDSSAIELCCLYAVSHLGYQLLKASKTIDFDFVADLESKRQIAHSLHDVDIKSNLEKAEISFLMFERLECLESFRKAIRLNPFNISAYESRLETHLLSNYDLEAASDSIRLICLNRNYKEAYLCLLKTLGRLEEQKRAEIIARRYVKFLEGDDKELLQKVLCSNEVEPSIIKYESDSKSLQDCKDLRECARQGSVHYMMDNFENAQLYYGVCMKTAREKPNWRYSMSWKDGALFMLAVQYCYAQSLLRMEKYEAALDSFLKLRRYHKLYPFPAAHLYAAHASMKLRRYCEARQNIEAGLKLCDAHGLSPLRWPGTEEPISECLPQQVKIELLKLQAQIVHECEAIATCRYAGCLGHNISRQIIREDPDFKGYTLVRCSEKCSIGFHPTCWRRFKTTRTEHSNEKNLISTPCVTPDCPGKVTHIAIYETGPKPKYEVSSDDSKSAITEDETKPTVLPPFSKSDSQDKKKRSHYSSLTSPIEPEKGNIVKEKAVRQQEKENLLPAEPVKQKPITEDDRKSEDSVGVINRQAEEDKDQKQTKTKKKKKSKQHKEATTKENSCKWDDLFILPERKGMINESSEANQEFPSWEPDPAAPFAVPEHLKDKVSQFESGKLQDEESQHSDTTKEPSQTGSTDYDYVISYFVELFKSHGPLHPMDSILSDGLQILPDKSQKLIDSYGDLSDFLLSSPLFRTFVGGAKIGLKEDRALIAEAMHNSHSKYPELSELVKEHYENPKKKPNFSLTENDHEAPPLPTMSSSSSSSGSPPLSSKNNKKGKQKTSKEVKKEVPLAPVVSKVDEPTKISESTKESDKVSTAKQADKVSSVKEANKTSTSETQSGTSKSGHETGGRPRNEVKTKSSNEKIKKESFAIKKGSSDVEKTVGVSRGEGVNGTSVAMETKHSCDPDVVKPEIIMRDVEIQTETTLHVHQCVNTDPQPVVESFKERYEEVKKEKMSLEKKLEVSEDMRVKLQKQSSRELEKTIKKANKEKDEKISQMEESIKEEKEKLSKERKEVNELVRATKNETKSLNEKINKLKKDMQRKEKEKNDSVSLLQEECEHLTKEKKKLEEHYSALVDAKHQRAVEAEVQLLTQRKDSILKPGEQRLQDLERLCIYASQALPGGEPELNHYKEQLKTALEGYKNALDDQIRKLRSGEELNQLEMVPAPVLPMSPQLRMRAQLVQRSLIVSLQRGATSMFPTAPLPVSIATPTSLDPAAMLASTPQPQPAMAPTFPTAINPSSIEFLNQPMTGGLGLGPSGLGMNMGGMGLAGYGSNPASLNTGFAGMTPTAAPSNLGINPHGLSGIGPTMTGTADLSGTGMGPIMTVSNNLSGIGTGTTNVTAGMGFNGTGMGLANTLGTSQSGTVPPSKPGNTTEKGNFDQLVATLAPLYPKYTRDDFKLAVLELRQRQKMSLTGLPLEAVIEKVKEVIEARENQSSLLMNQMPSLPSMPVHSLTQPVQTQGPMPRVNSSQLPPLPPPPLAVTKPSEVEYNEDNSCIICYEEMEESDSAKLECGHIFHTHCIRSWLNEQSTCPTCRNYALLPEDFPHLH